MDVGALSTGLAAVNVGTQIDVGVLKAAENLDQNLVARLFSSIGLGSGFDAYA